MLVFRLNEDGSGGIHCAIKLDMVNLTLLQKGKYVGFKLQKLNETF